MLLVLVSMVDNMPYVLAEASVMGIPLLIYDVGGVTEMIDPKLHADVICGSPKVIPHCPTRISKDLCTCHLTCQSENVMQAHYGIMPNHCQQIVRPCCVLLKLQWKLLSVRYPGVSLSR